MYNPADKYDKWEWMQERAAILEYEAGMTRQDAEYQVQEWVREYERTQAAE